MLPFCGYDMGDYFAHWLRVGAGLGDAAPEVFQVNWFRKGADGSFLWPGFGENSRVIAWIAGRLAGTAEAVETPLGSAPAPGALDLTGLEITEEALAESFAVPTQAWLAECTLTDAFFARFGGTLPPELHAELADLRARLASAP
nr:hypothetical protein GCM10025699_63340 [Microbacterium flavescens]